MARYKLRQHLFAFGDDFTIEDANGNPAFEVDGKAFSIRDSFELKDPGGRVVAKILGRFALRQTMDVLRDDVVVARITKKLLSFFPKFDVEITGGPELDVDGSIFEHEYTLRRGDTPVAHISKQFFSFSDTYGIDVAEGEDDALVLAIAVALDEMSHDDKK
jgi:uncharacterized protein YxjI